MEILLDLYHQDNEVTSYHGLLKNKPNDTYL